MTKLDPTFDPVSAYGSAIWVAKRLGGRGRTWFNSHREELEAEGFPKPDPLTGQYIKADVDAWIKNRRKIHDKAVAAPQPESQTVRINDDAL